MNKLSAFQRFGRVNNKVRVVEKLDCVIYTRVSSKKQFDNNASIETQVEACRKFASQMGYSVKEEFGGTYESANTRNRKEFERMLTYLRRNKSKIGQLIVYSPDRFVRDLDEGTQVLSELKRLRIRLHTVTQSVDDQTPSGMLHRQIQMAFSEYDNQLRREKCVSGTVTRLKAGGYCGIAPMGYDNVSKNGKRTIVHNENAVYVKKIFEMKGFERLANCEIAERIMAMGGPRCYKQLLDGILKNPTYCGLLNHKLLNGQVVRGRHDPIISEELFLLVNGQKNRPQGYRIQEENDYLPLKRFVACAKCGTPFTGYLVKSKGLYYYKCNKKGCKVNHSAKRMNQDFHRIISQFSLDAGLRNLAQRELLSVYQESNKDKVERGKMLKANRQQLEKKIERLEERFIEEEVGKALFEKYKAKYEASISGIDLELSKVHKILSNPEKLIRFATQIGANLGKIWDSAPFSLRHRLQEMVFPEGMSFDKETDTYRTPRVSSIFRLFAILKPDFEHKKNGQYWNNSKLSISVGNTGLEPVTPCL